MVSADEALGMSAQKQLAIMEHALDLSGIEMRDSQDSDDKNETDGNNDETDGNNGEIDGNNDEIDGNDDDRPDGDDLGDDALVG